MSHFLYRHLKGGNEMKLPGTQESNHTILPLAQTSRLHRQSPGQLSHDDCRSLKKLIY